MMRWAPATALLVAAVVAASATAAGLGPTTRVTVKPASGTPQTRFAFSFRVPVATGTFGLLARTDTFSMSGPGGARCQQRLSRTLRPAKKGKRLTLRLRPAKGRGGWCAGQWHGTVVQSEDFRCTPGPARVCPDLVVAPRVIASFRFRVTPAAKPSPPTSPAGDVPAFAGLVSASSCPSPTPQPARLAERPEILPRPSSYTLTWKAATDPVTPSAQIVYVIFVATQPGGEDYATPTYTTSAGATSYTTPGVPRAGALYFVVRARNAAGHEDTNTVERLGVTSCPPVSEPGHQPA
jgi:hypothetical protein